MLDTFRQVLNGEVEVPAEYIYYLVGLNIITIVVFLYAIYYTQKVMNQDDDDDQDSDTGFLDENGNLVKDDSISGGTATNSSSSNDSLQAPKVYRRVRKGL